MKIASSSSFPFHVCPTDCLSVRGAPQPQPHVFFLSPHAGWSNRIITLNALLIRHPFSKACLQHSQTFIQPCMWFLRDGTGMALCCFTNGELAGLFHEPLTGLDDCLRMLQECFRKRTSFFLMMKPARELDLRNALQSCTRRPSEMASLPPHLLPPLRVSTPLRPACLPHFHVSLLSSYPCRILP